MSQKHIININNPTQASAVFDVPMKDANGKYIYHDVLTINAQRFIINGKQPDIASTTQLGVVKVGNNLTIDGTGTLHAQISSNVTISTPEITGDNAIIGQPTTFHVRATEGLANATLTRFVCNLTGCPEQTVQATDSEADVTFTVPNGIQDEAELTFTCVAYDDFNNRSQTATKVITAKEVGVNTPSVSLDLLTGYVKERPTISVTNTFTVTGNEETTFSDTLDHIVYTIKKNNDVIWTKNSSEYNILVDMDLSEGVEYTFTAQFIGHSLLSSVGSIVKSTPSAFYTINTPTVTLNATSHGLPEELIITSSEFGVKLFDGTSSIDETHASTTWTLFEDDVQVWQSANDITNLTSIICGYALKTLKTYRVTVVYHGSRGHSSAVGDAIGTTPDVFAIVNPTTMSVDYNDNDDYYNGLALTAHTAAFSAIGDTHAATDWKICSDEAGTSVLAEVVGSSDLTSHTFPQATMKTINPGTVYVFARHKGMLTGYSAECAKTTITLKAPVVDTPSVTSPSVNAEQYYGQTMTVTMSVHHVTGGSSIEGTGNWKICSDADGNNVLVNGTFNAGTSFDISIEDLTTAGAGTKYLFVQKNDNTYGLSEWSTGVVITIKQPVISTPVINSPSAGTSINVGQTLTVSCDNVTTDGGTGDVTYTVKVCANNSDSETGLLSKTSTSPSVTFTKSETKTLTAGTRYIFVQASWTYGTSSWGSSMNITVNIDPDAPVLAASNFKSLSTSDLPGLKSGTLQKSEHGRLLYRHTNNKGSVVVFDMFGTTMKMFVADAAYRAAKKFGGFVTDSSLTNFSSANTSGSWYLRGSADSQTAALGYTYTDSQLQSMWSNLSSDQTARANCNVWMTYVGTTDRLSIRGVPAVEYCRSLTSFDGITNGCDLGNEYECQVIYLESDNLDALDPTGSSNTTKLLGYTNTAGGRMYVNGADRIWSSTEYSSGVVLGVGYDGGCNGSSKASTIGVVPVREL